MSQILIFLTYFLQKKLGGEGGGGKSIQDIYNELMQWNRLNESLLPYSQFENMYNTAVTELGNDIIVLALYSRYEGRDWCIEVGFAPRENYIRKTGKNNVAGMYNLPNVWVLQSAQTSAYRCLVYGQVNGGTWNRGTNPSNTYYGYDNKCITASNYFDGWGMTWEGYSVI